MDLKAIFGKFSGQPVRMVEEPYELKSRHLGTIKGVQLKLDPDDPTVSDMKEAAAQAGLQLRLWWPGTGGTADYRLDRVNASIEKSDDGQWRISDDFSIG